VTAVGSDGGPARVTFDETYLALSRQWLRDPEIQRLARAEPVDEEAQRRWYDGLPGRADYAIWGIAYDGVPVGAIGLKHIGVDDGAIWFTYVGERAYWGRGIAPWAVAEMFAEARARGLSRLFAVVGKDNPRSLKMNLNGGFAVARDDGDSWWVVADVPPA
jgi:RimJ/RimL family protein N-acetyltransferase